MKVALMQPTFLPWMGYFSYLAQVDCFVLLDDFSTSRQSWQQRNRLFVAANRFDWVTVPIKISGNLGKPLNEMPLVENEKWRRKLKALFRTAYGRAPCFREVAEGFEAWLSRPQANLAELNMEFVEETSSKLGIKRRLVRSSSLDVAKGNRSRRVLAILRTLGATDYLAATGSFGYLRDDGVFPVEDIRTVFHHFEHPRYRQLHSEQFVPHLSILDAIANVGFQATARLITEGIREPYTWQQMSEASS